MLNPGWFYHAFKYLLHASQIGCNICRIRASLEGLNGLLYMSSPSFKLLVRLPVFVGTKSSIRSIERWQASRQIPHLFRRTFSFLTLTLSLKSLSQPSELWCFPQVFTLMISCWTFATPNSTSLAWTLPGVGVGQLPPAFSQLESLASLGNFGSIDTWLLYSLKQNSCPVRWLSFTSSKTSIACRRFIASLVRTGFVWLCDKDYLFVMMVCKRKGF